jgi:hypothetical protein
VLSERAPSFSQPVTLHLAPFETIPMIIHKHDVIYI